MENQKSNSLNYFIVFLLSYSFYTIQILSQNLFYIYSKFATPIICLFYFAFPLTIFLICKAINKTKIKQNFKNNFIYTILSSLYLIITSILSLTTIVNIILIYYYQQVSIIILLLFLILPIIYTLIKGDKSFFSLASILLIIFIGFKYSYLSNSTPLELYPFYNILNIKKSKIISLLIISSPILIEPIILLNNKKEMINKINTKWITIFAISLSLVGILTTLRQTWEFGNLLNKIRFPYLESAKNIIAGDFFENIDYYYLLSLSVSVYIRLGYTLITIKNNYSLNTIKTLLLLLVILVATFFLHSNMSFYSTNLNKFLFISSLCLILCAFLMPFSIKRRKKNV